MTLSWLSILGGLGQVKMQVNPIERLYWSKQGPVSSLNALKGEEFILQACLGVERNEIYCGNSR